jgi:L-ascorbate metabolism protein UlaG (beta-lactamase superfamily)
MGRVYGGTEMRLRVLGLILAFAIAIGLGNRVQAEENKTTLLWLGQSAWRITTPGGKNIVIDPFITQNPKTPTEWKDLDKLGKIDVVLVSHAHGDHLGDAAALVKKNNIQMFSPAGLADSLAALGVVTPEQAPRMNKGGTITPIGPDIKITAVHADHSSELTYMNPETKKKEMHVGGEPMGWIIKLENGFTIYHMGDTTLFSDIKLIADTYKPDLLLVPIGGHFVMDPPAAAAATKMVHPKYVIPMHYGTTPQLKGTPEEFAAALGKSSTKVMTMTPGQSLSF